MNARKLCSVALIGILAACTTGAVREEVEQQAQRIEQDLNRAKQPLPALNNNPLVVTDRLWTGSKSIRLNRGIPLPTRFEGDRGVSMVTNNELSLEDISSALAEQIGIPVRLGPGAPTGRSSSTASTVPGRGLPPGAPADSGGNLRVAYEGPLSGLLDVVAAHFAVNWNYDGTTIAFSKYETRVFQVEALPGKGTFSDSVSGDSGGGGGGGSGGGGGGGGGSSSGSSSSGSTSLTQTSKLEADLDVWSEIGSTVNALLGGTGTAVVSPSLGIITVTTTSDVMKNIARYIGEQNQRLVRQIAINIDVYTADIENEDNVSNQLDLALKAIKPFTFTGAAAPAFASAASSFNNLTIGLIDNPTITANTIVQALSRVSNNIRVAQFPMTTLNNVPITRRVGRDISYLASSSTTTNGTAATSTSTLSPSTLREGFSIQITPRLLADGRILLQYSLNLVDLIRLASFTSNGSSVQLPETSSRVFVQQSLLRSGSTLVLAGYSQDRTAQNANGTLDPYNILLGGGIGNDKIRSLLLIAITPQELDVPPVEKP